MKYKPVTFEDFADSRQMHKDVPTHILESFGLLEADADFNKIGFEYCRGYWIFFDGARGKFWTIFSNEDYEFTSLRAAECWLYDKAKDELMMLYQRDPDPMLDPQLG